MGVLLFKISSGIRQRSDIVEVLHSLWKWVIDHSENQLLGVIVGAVLAFIPALMIGWVRTVLTSMARRTALSAELELIGENIREIRGVIEGGQACTKRLNTDFLEASRIDWYKTDPQRRRIKALAIVYRNVVHTNGMLDRLENPNQGIKIEIKQERNRFDNSIKPDFAEAAKPILLSLEGAEGSIADLKKIMWPWKFWIVLKIIVIAAALYVYRKRLYN
jgi:hypothetical protein